MNILAAIQECPLKPYELTRCGVRLCERPRPPRDMVSPPQRVSGANGRDVDCLLRRQRPGVCGYGETANR